MCGARTDSQPNPRSVRTRLIEESVSRLRFSAPITRPRHARRRGITEPICQLDQATAQTHILHLRPAKLVHCPAPLVVHDRALVDKMA